MKIYNFDFMKDGSPEPIETISNMMRSLDEAKNRCINLYRGRASMIGATKVHLREDGGSTVIYSWPEES